MIVDVDVDEMAVVYTDGSCIGNGQKNAKAGIGIYIPDSGVRIGERLPGEQTNQRAEIYAVIRALEIDPRDLEIHTDSMYVVKAMTEWIFNWKNNGYKKVKNKDLFVRLDDLMRGRGIKFVHVRAHTGIVGNEIADQLARNA